MRDRETGRSRGFGFVTYGTALEAEAAIASMNDAEVDGRRLRVNVANQRTTGGGGGGGGAVGGGGPGGGPFFHTHTHTVVRVFQLNHLGYGQGGGYGAGGGGGYGGELNADI
jgi:RNA recognition motif-containing protein